MTGSLFDQDGSIYLSRTVDAQVLAQRLGIAVI